MQSRHRGVNIAQELGLSINRVQAVYIIQAKQRGTHDYCTLKESKETIRFWIKRRSRDCLSYPA